MGIGSSLRREIEGKDKDLFDGCLYNVSLSLQTPYLMYYSGRPWGSPDRHLSPDLVTTQVTHTPANYF